MRPPRWPGVDGFILVGFMLVGAVLLGLGVTEIVTTRQFLATASAADDVVVRVDTTTDKEGDSYYHPVVRFITAGGRVVQYTDSVGDGSPRAHRVGESVRVLYDPANPQEAQLDTWSNRWLGPTIEIGLAVAFLSISIVFLVPMLVSRKSPRDRTRQSGKASGRGRRRPRPAPPRSGAKPKQPSDQEPPEDRPQDSKAQDE
ncbi:DUF3592 domain-containing protein [Kribbella sp. CWNU-51]